MENDGINKVQSGTHFRWLFFFFLFKGRTGSLKLEERKAELLCILLEGVGGGAGRWILPCAGSRSILHSLPCRSVPCSRRILRIWSWAETLPTFFTTAWATDTQDTFRYVLLNCGPCTELFTFDAELCWNFTDTQRLDVTVPLDLSSVLILFSWLVCNFET